MSSITETASHIPLPPSRPASHRTVTTIDTVNENFSRRHTHGYTGGKAPHLRWHSDYDRAGAIRPRVLMIEYHRRDITQQVRKVTAREFKEIDELKSVYQTDRSESTVLRLFHVQNSPLAERYLLRKHAFDSHAPRYAGRSDSGHQDFARWVQEHWPQRRRGRLMMSAHTWKTHTDPWRGVTKTAFGMDYMKAYNCGTEEQQQGMDKSDSFVEDVDDVDWLLGLQGIDENDNTIHAYNIYSQRLSVYVQYKNRSPPIPDPDLVCPYGNNYETSIKSYDNGNTILIFDNSHNKSIYDTLIPARGHFEAKWRRLPFTATPTHGPDADREIYVNLHCMKTIIRDVFSSVIDAWEKVLEVSWEHVSILEDAIYEQPADESRAPELWKNSAYWNRYEKLMFNHTDSMNEMRRHLAEFADAMEYSTSDSGSGSGDANDKGNIIAPGAWLDELPEDFRKLENLVQEDLVKPTANMSELMYRSVAIRDSRASLQLGSSMWRLSWITFIFLPATFIVGFFGMNVGNFIGGDAPPIKWFFIVLVPFFTLILLCWYILKHLLARNRRTPPQRGLYEALYSQLEEQNPSLWTRQGPREHIRPVGWISRVKWRIIMSWTDESRLPKPGAYQEPVGAWNRLKRHLMSKWTREIKIETSYAGADELEPLDVGAVESGSKGAGVEVTRATVPLRVVNVDGVVAQRGTRRHQRQPDLESGNEADILPEDSGTRGTAPMRMAMGVGLDKNEGNSEVMVEEMREGPNISEEEATIISRDGH